MSSDGASIMEAAVRGACLAKAPRRTIQAVAAAVAGVLMRPTAAVETKSNAGVPGGARSRDDDSGDPATDPEARRAARRAKRAAKKERRKAARQADATLCSSTAPTLHPQTAALPGLQHGAEASTSGAAGSHAESGGTLVAEPAPAPMTTAAPDDHSRPSSPPVILEDRPTQAADTTESCGPPSTYGSNVEPKQPRPHLHREPGTASAGKHRPGPYATPAGTGGGKSQVHWKK